MAAARIDGLFGAWRNLSRERQTPRDRKHAKGGTYQHRSGRSQLICISLPSIQKCGVQDVQPKGTRDMNA